MRSVFKNPAIVAALAAIFCCNIAVGLAAQLLPLMMETQGFSGRFMGISAAMWPLGVILSSFFLPKLIKTKGARTVALASIISLAVCLALLPNLNPATLGLPIRLIFGVAIAGLFTVSESWILSEAQDSARGQVIGIYMTTLTITFGLGPLIVARTGNQSFAPWLIAIACLASGFLVIAKVKLKSTTRDEAHSSMLSVVTKIPLVFLFLGSVAMFENIMIPFFTIYGMRSGLSLAAASNLLGFSIIACALTYYPTGRLADRWSRRGVVIITLILAITCALLLAIEVTKWTAWPIALLLRTGGFGLYGVAMTVMGDKLKGAELITGSSLLTLMWGIGGIAGPPIAGTAIDYFGINALPFLIAAPFIICFAALALNKFEVVRANHD
jgi:MFS family permease